MSETSSNNKRIAKNTIFLYIRTLFTLLVSLYTSRVVLQMLGVDDYGIYNVIGGLVAMFSVGSGALSISISRFITFEIGHGDKDKLRRIFSTSVLIQLGISLLVVCLAEIIAIWFIRNEMQIPADRLDAAEWVLHWSVLTFCISLISIPYNACIIAHEHMKVFAYISILEVSLKLAVCFLLVVSPFDRLKFYAVLLAVVAVVVRLVYAAYCHRHFEETQGKTVFDKAILKEMLGFSGWSFFTNTTSVLNNQGVNMLINVFFGVAVNAARGIALQVESAVVSFVNNFTMAVNPQITKSYASGDIHRMYSLVCNGAKYSYFAMLLMALPIICETETILNIWLTEVPEHTVIFVQLSLILGMCDCVGSSGYTACMAAGKIRKYSLVITPLGLLEFPFVWIAFSLGAPVESAYYLYVFVKVVVIIARLFLLREMIGLKVKTFVIKVFRPILFTTAAAIIVPVMIIYMLPPSLYRLALTLVAGLSSVTLSSLYLGMSQGERTVIISKAMQIIKKIKK